jgi:hypothetical protein
MNKLVLATALTFAFAGPAFANSCPTLAAKIDEAMKTATLDDATKAKVTDLRTKGMAAHDSGDHATSEKDLGEALKLLGM